MSLVVSPGRYVVETDGELVKVSLGSRESSDRPKRARGEKPPRA